MVFMSVYIFIQNFIAKQSWRILNIIKDAIFTDNKLSKTY